VLWLRYESWAWRSTAAGDGAGFPEFYNFGELEYPSAIIIPQNTTARSKDA